ncbi:MAG: hypothetical protein PHV62_00160 [Sulfuricurvum sp.]|nr:hypothetical protein [Sulfuricurvum sp.]
MKNFYFFVLVCIIIANGHALEPFQEQTSLGMTTTNATKDQSVKWIPLTSNPQETAIQNTKSTNKSIEESIKNQIQKKMQTLLKPLKDDEDER